MAWTAVVTHATGDVFPASDWNTYVRDNLKYLHGDTGGVQFANNAYLLVTNTSAAGWAYTAFAIGDTNNRFQVDISGTMHWGPGNAGADTNLYRIAPGVLQTDGRFASLSTNAGTLSFSAAVNGDSSARWYVQADGQIQWGPGNAATDVNLYRLSGGNLRTNASFWADGSVIAGTVSGSLYVGGPLDTVFSRYAAGEMVLSNKLLEGNPAFANVTVPATFTPNLATGLIQRVNVSAGGASTLTIAAPTNPPSGVQSALLVVHIANAGGGTITLSWNAAFAGGSTLALPTSRATGTQTVVLFVWDGSLWRIVSIG